jgi:hypothetical protein
MADVPHRVTWRAIKALHRKPWDSKEYLLAELVDLVRWLQWTKTADGHKNINQPEPLKRPGEDERRARSVQAIIQAVTEAGLLDRQEDVNVGS